MKIVYSLLLMIWSAGVAAQSFYDLQQIQEIKIYFPFADWDYQLDTAKAGTEGYLKADSVVVNGETFLNCGVKYKGNSSYDVNRIKNPVHIKLDYKEKSDYHGVEDIKLGNAWSDNSMIREPLCYSILSQYMDAPRGNFAKVYINDGYYGLMNNAESIDSKFLEDHFFSSKYSFIKCNPVSIGAGLGNGPNLAYLGSAQSSYENIYELKSDAGWDELIQLCDTLNNQFSAFSQIADIDRMLWMLAFNNATVNLDSYTGTFRQNYYLYRDHNRQWIPIVWDLNMCMGGFSIAGGTTGALTPATMPTMNYTLHKTESGWPLINKLLNDPLYSKMYLAHLRTINSENFAGGQFKALASSLHDLIDPEIPNDPNFLSNYADFQVSLNANTPGTNGAGISPGLFPLMDSRSAYLSNVLSAAPPVIGGITVSNGGNFGSIATITATVSNSTKVYLGYRYAKTDPFQRVQMFDDGAHGDGAAGDQVYGAECPLFAVHVQYYLYAENANTGAFSPERAEHEFYLIETILPMAAAGEVVINELTANNQTGIQNEKGKVKDWIELYHSGSTAVGLSGLYLSNQPDVLTKWAFPADAVILPGEHLLVWADDIDVTLVDMHTNFNLNRLGDKVFLSDGTTIFDQVEFGEQVTDYSLSRCPDGTGNFQPAIYRTPEAVNDCTSVTMEVSGVGDLHIVPNPASDWVTIQAPSLFSNVNFYNTTGQLILTATGNQVDISGLAPGLYWTAVQLEHGQWVTGRVVKR